jgi:hypothetical protein
MIRRVQRVEEEFQTIPPERNCKPFILISSLR